MRIVTASWSSESVNKNPILPIKIARETTLKNGNAFYVRDYKSPYDYVFSFVNGVKYNYIEIIQFRLYDPYVYKGDWYWHYKESGRITFPYYDSIAWVYDFNFRSYIKNGGDANDFYLKIMNPGWTDLIYYHCRDGVVVETLMNLDNSGDADAPRYDTTDPDNNAFYRQLVHDMLKFNIISEYTVKKRLHILTGDILESDNEDE